MTFGGHAPKQVFYGWYVVLGLFLIAMVSAGVGFYSFGIFIRPLSDQFGWSRGAVSVASSLYFVIGGLASPLLGRWIDSHDVRKTIIICVLCFGGGFILLSLTRSLWYFYLLYAILGIMQTGISLVPMGTIVSRWFIRQRGVAMGITAMGFSVGGLVLAQVAGYAVQSLGWRGAFATLGVLSWLLALPPAILLIKGRPEEKGLAPDGEAPGHPPPAETEVAVGRNLPAGVSGFLSAFKEPLKKPYFWWTAAAYFCVTGAQAATLQHQNPFARDIGIPLTMAATALAVTSGMGAVGKPVFGKLADRFPAPYVAMGTFALQALGVVLLMRTTTLAQLWLHVVTFGVSVGGIPVLMPLIVGMFFGMRGFGTAVGLLSLIQSLGNALGTAFAGFVHDATGSYTAAFSTFLVLYAVGITSVFLAYRTAVRRLPAAEPVTGAPTPHP